MRRRDVARVLLGAAVLPGTALGQQRRRVFKAGYLFPGPEDRLVSRINALREGLAKSGFLDPAEVVIVARASGGDPHRLRMQAAELVAADLDVLVSVSPAALRAVLLLTDRLPVVAHDLESDPIADGFVRSFSRPGTNVTGLFLDIPSLSAKWLELLHELLPNLARVVAMWDPDTGRGQPEALEAAGRATNVDVDVVQVRSANDIGAAMAAFAERRAQAAVLLSSPFFGTAVRATAELTLIHRIPAVTLFGDYAREGGLMAYGPKILDTLVQVGSIAGKVLRGTSPAEVPVERPTRFELVINARVASALGLTIPPTLLARADEVIE